MTNTRSFAYEFKNTILDRTFRPTSIHFGRSQNKFSLLVKIGWKTNSKRAGGFADP